MSSARDLASALDTARRVILRSMDERDAGAVASVHMRSFVGYRSSRLGRRYVEAMYRWFAASPDAFGIIAEIEGRTLGFVAGCTDGYSSAQSRALMNAFVRSVVLRPWVLLTTDFARALVSRTMRMLAGHPGHSATGRVLVLLSIAVAPDAAGKGYAGLLIEAFEDEARRRGFQRVRLTVRSDNRAARRAYEKAGWRVTDAFAGRNGTAYVKDLK